MSTYTVIFINLSVAWKKEFHFFDNVKRNCGIKHNFIRNQNYIESILFVPRTKECPTATYGSNLYLHVGIRRICSKK